MHGANPSQLQDSEYRSGLRSTDLGFGSAYNGFFLPFIYLFLIQSDCIISVSSERSTSHIPDGTPFATRQSEPQGEVMICISHP